MRNPNARVDSTGDEPDGHDKCRGLSPLHNPLCTKLGEGELLQHCNRGLTDLGKVMCVVRIGDASTSVTPCPRSELPVPSSSRCAGPMVGNSTATVAHPLTRGA